MFLRTIGTSCSSKEARRSAQTSSSRNFKSPTVAEAAARTLSSSSFNISSRNGTASQPVRRKIRVKTSAMPRRRSNSSRPCRIFATLSPCSWSYSRSRARQRMTFEATSSCSSSALRTRMSTKPSGSINAGRSRRSLTHSISSKRRSSSSFSKQSRSHVAASTPASCATTDVVLGTTAFGFHPMFCGPSSGCVCHVPGRSANAMDSTKW